ncbi:hypothetical protein GNI_012080 [Gregarina niphandrodes]|uniref:Uncharacterized protein n=1 Tax=Gregarina niphandrodes TaxID=110365 RepID=A0A023BCP0_GRENI|nr:hypothetical protein GNI_012080 [Gregarina niphandrodes]EZG85048.1 hypothetical protein GNI_012080 [Gregarina niphandrodes]|eukprot:XP_011128841.1 hypothetical protein GNI_012080 [Gregarina niphandrodes]
MKCSAGAKKLLALRTPLVVLMQPAAEVAQNRPSVIRHTSTIQPATPPLVRRDHPYALPESPAARRGMWPPKVTDPFAPLETYVVPDSPEMMEQDIEEGTAEQPDLLVPAPWAAHSVREPQGSDPLVSDPLETCVIPNWLQPPEMRENAAMDTYVMPDLDPPEMGQPEMGENAAMEVEEAVTLSLFAAPLGPEEAANRQEAASGNEEAGTALPSCSVVLTRLVLPTQRVPAEESEGGLTAAAMAACEVSEGSTVLALDEGEKTRLVTLAARVVARTPKLAGAMTLDFTSCGWRWYKVARMMRNELENDSGKWRFATVVAEARGVARKREAACFSDVWFLACFLEACPLTCRLHFWLPKRVLEPGWTSQERLYCPATESAWLAEKLPETEESIKLVCALSRLEWWLRQFTGVPTGVPSDREGWRRLAKETKSLTLAVRLRETLCEVWNIAVDAWRHRLAPELAADKTVSNDAFVACLLDLSVANLWKQPGRLQSTPVSEMVEGVIDDCLLAEQAPDSGEEMLSVEGRAKVAEHIMTAVTTALGTWKKGKKTPDLRLQRCEWKWLFFAGLVYEHESTASMRELLTQAESVVPRPADVSPHWYLVRLIGTAIQTCNLQKFSGRFWNTTSIWECPGTVFRAHFPHEFQQLPRSAESARLLACLCTTAGWLATGVANMRASRRMWTSVHATQAVQLLRQVLGQTRFGQLVRIFKDQLSSNMAPPDDLPDHRFVQCLLKSAGVEETEVILFCNSWNHRAKMQPRSKQTKVVSGMRGMRNEDLPLKKRCFVAD